MILYDNYVKMSNVFCDYYHFCSVSTKKQGKTIKYDICAPSKTVPPASGEAGGNKCYSLITVLPS